MTKRITIAAPERETFTVDLVGREYLVHTPKAAIAMSLSAAFSETRVDPKTSTPEEQAAATRAMRDAMLTWVRAAFSKKGAADVEARLDDPEDTLDFDSISRLMEALTEEETGLPPTSSPDSSERPESTDSTSTAI